MKIWPIVLDSEPVFLSGPGDAGSLLLAPLGDSTVLAYVRACLAPITRNAPLVVPRSVSLKDYADRIMGASPGTRVALTADALADAVANIELSDALLIVDPRCLPALGLEFSRIVDQHSVEPRMSHHLISFKRAIAGTQERVSFDKSGRVRKILRHYESTTWPFIEGVCATLVSAASGILSEGKVPACLGDLRRMLSEQAVPSRDVAVQGDIFNLADEGGLLAANDYFARRSFNHGQTAAGAGRPQLVGSGHSIHPSARISGSVVVHSHAQIEADAMVFGPAVIGSGARIGSRAVVTHSVLAAGCAVPAGAVITGRVWSADTGNTVSGIISEPTYRHRLARVIAETRSARQATIGFERPLRGSHALLKRLLDVTMAALALILLSPIMCVAGLVSWLESGAPLFYGDEREGLNGRVFRCWKFRTMFVGAHAAQLDFQAIDKMDGPHFKIDKDPRVTRVGRVLRALNVDELPQLVNVLTGEMSLVGPRPSPFRENQVCVPWREARLAVQPGITGMWQVCRHDRADGDFHQWIEYDLLYVQNMSFWLDLKILAATIFTLGGKAGHVSPSRLLGLQSAPAAHWTARSNAVTAAEPTVSV